MLGHDSLPVAAWQSATHLDPGADDFQPATMRQNGNTEHSQRTEVSFQSLILNLLNRVGDLEHGQQDLRGEIEELRMAQADIMRGFHSPTLDLSSLSNKVNEIGQTQLDLTGQVEQLKQGGWSVEVGPFQSMTAETAMARSKHKHTRDQENLNANITQRGANQITPGNSTNESAKGRSIPPHLRNRAANNALVTDGFVDSPLVKPSQVQVPIQTEPTPPATPVDPSAIESQLRQAIEDLQVDQSDKEWKPLAVTKFSPLAKEILDIIPSATDMVTFSIDFLVNEFGGIMWSPGLMFIPPTPPSPSMLKNRTYYTLDARNEPYLPKAPGRHGAKLTAFFNDNPEEVYPDAITGCSFEDVPMFVAFSPSTLSKTKDVRYVYFGNYTQTRWSDKLDYDRMVENVPQNVKEYWAKELSAMGRDEWVTEALMKNFFPKPEYTGRLPSEVAEGSVTREEQDSNDERVMKDLRSYLRELRAWEKDARLKTRLIKKDDILRAFDSADADDPPALRLWWEYLECVDWDKQFYTTLATVQSRNKSYDPQPLTK